MNQWYPFENGETIGRRGSENGLVVRDEEHSDGARVTLECVNADRLTITCGIYGWMVHTRFFDYEAVALAEFDETKRELEKILTLIPLANEANDETINIAAVAMSDFVDRCQ